jgi:diguanylate cyclase (GGDEF)-like protein
MVPAPHSVAARAGGLLRKVTAVRLPSCIDALVAELEAGLWRSGERARSDADRGRLSTDTTLIAGARRNRALQQRLLDDLSAVADAPARGPELQRRSGPQPGAPLSLVDTDEFELSLAKTKLANRIERDQGEVLKVLRGQAKAAWGAPVPLPIEPRSVTEALDEALAGLGVEMPTRRLALAVLAPVLPRLLGPVYRELARAWEDAGITPGEVRTHTRPPRKTVRAASRATTAPPVPVGDAPSPRDGPPPGGAGAGAPSLDSGRLIDLLMRLPDGARDSSGWRRSGDSLKGHIVGLLADVAPQIHAQAIPQGIEQRMDATDRVLAHMLEDRWMPAALRAWIERLAPRYLAAALAEPGFFGASGHPFARLLDRLERLAALAGEAGATESPVWRDIEAALAPLLVSDPRDVPGISNVDAALARLERRLDTEYQRNVLRAITRHEAQARTQTARRFARAQLNRAFAGRRVHRAVAALIGQAWQTLLELVYLRQGEQGADWNRWWQALVSAHRLCGGEGPAAAPTLRSPGQVLADIDEGFAYLGLDALRAEQLLTALDAAMSHHSPSGEGGYEPFPEIPPDTAEAAATAPAGAGTAADWQGLLARVEGLARGTELFQRDNGDGRRWRFIWRSPAGDRLVFSDGRGQHIRAFSQQALAEALREGTVQLQPPSPGTLTDRATDATLQEMQARIAFHETPDPVTGLKGRRQLLGSLAAAIAEDARLRQKGGLAFIDLDYFEAVRASGGYQAGERLLAAVARLLQLVLEDSPCIAHLGESRFGALLTPADGASLVEAGERIRSALNGLPFHWKGQVFPVAGSIGVVDFASYAGHPDAVFSAADSACLAARHAGGDRVVAFRADAPVIAEQKADMAWLMELEGLLRRQRLRLRAQRIGPPGARAPLHHEVLLSVYNASGDPLDLGEVIRIAETHNLMPKLDRLVLDRALEWLSAHRTEAESLGGLAINLSGQSLADEALVEHLRERLHELAVPTALVSFEVTETAAIANLERAAAIVGGIRSLGCHFALDDFGVGLSSYTYLKHLPVDYLKIDGSFVRNILIDPHDLAIVKSINEVAHFMGKQTIAEYVESEAILERLQAIGVDHMQGYACGKPQFLDELSGAAAHGAQPARDRGPG